MIKAKGKPLKAHHGIRTNRYEYVIIPGWSAAPLTVNWSRLVTLGQ